MAGVLRVGTKFGIIGGTVYFSDKLGVWGDSSHTERLYKDLYHVLAPYLQDIPVEVPELPHISDITSIAKNYWNSGVLRSGRFILSVPELTSSAAKEGYSKLLAQINTHSGSSN